MTNELCLHFKHETLTTKNLVHIQNKLACTMQPYTPDIMFIWRNMYFLGLWLSFFILEVF